jgi:ABC-type sugar transport system substrate-binding protein
MALGAVDALKAADRLKSVTVGFDGNSDEVKLIAAGEIAATFAQKPANIAIWQSRVMSRHCFCSKDFV